jgi:hypothetical protein
VGDTFKADLIPRTWKRDGRPNINAFPHHKGRFVYFDIDDIPIDNQDDTTNIDVVLPIIYDLIPELAGADCVYQFSSGAGLITNPEGRPLIRVRLYAEFAEEVDTHLVWRYSQMSDWIDHQQNVAGQIAIIAPPAFHPKSNKSDPFLTSGRERWGYVQGTTRFLDHDPIVRIGFENNDGRAFSAKQRAAKNLNDNTTPDRIVPRDKNAPNTPIATTDQEVRAQFLDNHQHAPTRDYVYRMVQTYGEFTDPEKVLQALYRLSEGAPRPITPGCDKARAIPADIRGLLAKAVGVRLVPTTRSPKQLTEALAAMEKHDRTHFIVDGKKFSIADCAFSLAVRHVNISPFKHAPDFAHYFKYPGVESALRAYLANLEKELDQRLQWPGTVVVDSIEDIDQPAEGIFVVKAGCGIGKTRDIGGPALQAASPRNRVHISPRVALATSAAEVLGLSNYEEIKKSNATPDGLAVCVNSITHAALRGYIDDAHTVVIDELHSLLRSLGTPGIQQHAAKVLEALSSLVRHAKRVVVLDADLSDSDLKHLAKLAGKREFQVFQVIEDLSHKTFHLTDMKGIAARLRNETPALFATDHKSELLGLKGKGFFDDGLIISAENPQPDFMKAPDKIAAASKGHIGFTPSCDTGVSLKTGRDMLAYFKGIVTGAAMYQMVNRERLWKRCLVALPQRVHTVKSVRAPDVQARIYADAIGREEDYDLFAAEIAYEQAQELRYGPSGFLRAMALRGAKLTGKVTYSDDLEKLEKRLAGDGAKALAKDIFNADVIPLWMPPEEVDGLVAAGEYTKLDKERYYCGRALGREPEKPADVAWWRKHGAAFKARKYMEEWIDIHPDDPDTPATKREFLAEKRAFFDWFLGELGTEWSAATRDRVAGLMRSDAQHIKALKLLTASDSYERITNAGLIDSTLGLIGRGAERWGANRDKYRQKDRIKADKHRANCDINARKRNRITNARTAFIGTVFDKPKFAEHEAAFSELLAGKIETLDLWPDEKPSQRKRRATVLWGRIQKQGGLLAHTTQLNDDGVFVATPTFFNRPNPELRPLENVA